MNMAFPAESCRAALVPAAGFNALGHLRALDGIRVVPGDPAWMTWDRPRSDLVVCLLAVPGVQLFEPRDGHWFRPGSRLPAVGVPSAGETVSLDRFLLPAGFTPIERTAIAFPKVPLSLVRSEAPQPTTALRCRIAALSAWADRATTAEISAVKAARYQDMAWLMGPTLPAIAESDRFWGERVLLPLGFRAEPNWPESALREAAAVGPDEILIITDGTTEAIALDAFRPLRRADIRRAMPGFPVATNG